MERVAAISLLLCVGFLASCQKTYRYTITDLSKPVIFKPYVAYQYWGSEHYYLKVYGEADGEWVMQVVGSTFKMRPIKTPCSLNYPRVFTAGKVEHYEVGDYYEDDVYANVVYIPCGAQKGHLTIEVTFNKELER